MVPYELCENFVNAVKPETSTKMYTQKCVYLEFI